MSAFFHIMTFGCQMNVNDSDWLARALRLRGFEQAPLEQANVVILNTCSVREKPEQKVYAAINRIRHATRNTPNAFVVVAGCVAQQIGTGFFDRFPQVRLVTGGDGLAATPDAIERLLHEPELRLSLVDFSEIYPERPHSLGAERIAPLAYVNIMQGCDNFCAYCIVPYTRGRQKSRSSTAVLDECRALLEHGAREITLLGQNVNSFGQDKNGDGTTFATLLRQVAALPGLERLRFVTPHPKDFPQEVVRLFGELEVLCPRLHLPLQSGSDAILHAMGRKYDSATYLRIVAQLREVRPDIAFSSDIIVGFPGETEEDFQQTLAVMEGAGLMSSFSFCYSERPGSRATLLPNKVPQETKLERLARLQTLQETLGQRWLNARIGQDTLVLLEGPSKKGVQDAPCANTALDTPPANGQPSASPSPGKPAASGAVAMDTMPIHITVTDTVIDTVTQTVIDTTPRHSATQEGATLQTAVSADRGIDDPEKHIFADQEHWQGKDPYGVTVNLLLPAGHDYVGLLQPVSISHAKRHTLVGNAKGEK